MADTSQSDHSSASISTLTDSFRLLRTRRFGTFFFATLLSNLGTWAQQIAEPWLLLSLGASSFLLGLDSFAMAAPVGILTLFGGVLADRADRRRIIAACQTAQMLCPALLVLLLITGWVQPWMVIVLSIVVGVTDALSMPSFQTIVPSIVEHEQIPSALALNATQFNLSRVLGPAFAGILMAGVGAVGCFALNALSYVPFIWVALWILPRGRPPARDDEYNERDYLFTGIHEIIRDPDLRGGLLTVLVTSILCAPLIVFCPVIVTDMLHRGVTDFSASIGAFGLGGLTGAILLLGIAGIMDPRRLSSWCARGYGVVLILAALNQWFWALPLLLAFAGAAMTVSNTSVNTLLQSAAPPTLRGQTISLYMVAMRGGASLGSLATGLSLSLVGVRDALLINGTLAIVAQIGVGLWWYGALRGGRGMA